MTSRKDILESLVAGKISVDEADALLQGLSMDSIDDIAVIDIEREKRTGIPEVILAGSKSQDDLLEITKKMCDRKGAVLLTRVRQPQCLYLKSQLNDLTFEVMGNEDHLTVIVTNKQWKYPTSMGTIAVITAGTSDIPYAKEIEGIAKIMGVEVLKFYDVGIAGIHRVVEPIKQIRRLDVDAIAVLAGMEGALPSVVASLVDIPVIGVPVPTGYGFGGQGKTALASMLQSCAPGLSVVNIGNGFGAGAVACLIAKKRHC
jgi:NCAIR mutase (PurE)-related protein